MLSPDAAVNAEGNPWLPCAFLVAVRLWGMGMAWRGLWPDDSKEDRPCWAVTLEFAARIAAVGFLFNLLLILFLSSLGWYRTWIEWGGWFVLCAAGSVAFPVSRRKAAPRHGAVIAAALPAAASAAIMLLPQRGEWLLGGWDPGLYISQGVELSRTGRLHPAPEAFFAELSEAELDLFTRRVFNYTEAHPVVPVDRTTRALVPFFFPGTPAVIAWLHRCGGLRAATRVNDFAGALAVLLFWAFAWRVSGRVSWSVLVSLALLLQPLFLFHTHFPTSEMTQLLLLSGWAMTRMTRRDGDPPHGLAGDALGALFLLAAQVNRFSFLPFGLLLLLLLACGEAARTDRRRVATERTLQLGALGIGLASNYWTNELTIGRLAHVTPALLGCSLVLAIAILLIDAPLLPAAWKRRLAGLFHGSVPRVAWIVAVLLTGWALFRLLSAPRMLGWNLRAAAPFLGLAWVLLAAPGGWWLVSVLRRRGGAAVAWFLFLLGSTLISFSSGEIAPILPWALRRHVEFTLPLLALAAGSTVWAVWEQGRARRRMRTAALLLFLATAAVHARRAAQAWLATEHDGLSAVLARAAARIAPGDIVVADHFRWGTPLRFIHGRTVLNGEVYYEPPDAARFKEALDVLGRFQAKGRRVLFLVSTPEGLTVYPGAVEPVRLEWTSAPWLDREVVQSGRARRFVRREKERVFRLYTWRPEEEGAGRSVQN